MSDDLNRMLGQIDGKLDQVISTFNRHIDDDVRRFTEVHGKIDAHKQQVNEKFSEHSEDINKAKGAKAALMWAAGGIAGAVAFAAPYVAKALGIK
jgi:endonuclease III-like uncharacterized protein